MDDSPMLETFEFDDVSTMVTSPRFTRCQIWQLEIPVAHGDLILGPFIERFRSGICQPWG